MLPRDFYDIKKQVLRIKRTRGVVRVDYHDSFCICGHLFPDIGDIGAPVRLLVAAVVNRRAAGKRDRGGPERIVRARNQDFIAFFQKRLYRN